MLRYVGIELISLVRTLPRKRFKLRLEVQLPEAPLLEALPLVTRPLLAVKLLLEVRPLEVRPLEEKLPPGALRLSLSDAHLSLHPPLLPTKL